MGQILVRSLDDQVIERLKQRAKREKTSLEQAARQILTDAAKPSRDEVVEEIDALRQRIKRSFSDDSTNLVREERDNKESHR